MHCASTALSAVHTNSLLQHFFNDKSFPNYQCICKDVNQLENESIFFPTQQIDYIDGKGRGVIATKHFNRGEFVVEYHGDLIEITDAKKREAVYAQDPSTGCYMYYFQYLSKTYW